jgi:hypothetical protein
MDNFEFAAKKNPTILSGCGAGVDEILMRLRYPPCLLKRSSSTDCERSRLTAARLKKASLNANLIAADHVVWPT